MAKASELAKPWTPEEASWFPLAQDPAPRGTFEMGLVLGGTVSAGAYTAGVLDFLLEALDAWGEELKLRPTPTPDWNVSIRAISGTSGGGVLAAMFAKALSWKFDPVRASDPPEAGLRNPFYDVWVERLDVDKMLETSDIVSGQPLRSVLNAKCLEEAAAFVAAYPENLGVQPAARDFVPEPIPIYLTLTDLRGLPCRVGFQGKLGQNYTEHAEYAKVCVYTRGGNANLRPDAYGVSKNPGQTGFVGWGDVTRYALGTSAFPIGFPPRDLSLPAQHLRLRPIVVVPPAPPAAASPAGPVVMGRPIYWDALADAKGNVPDDFRFAAVDGGVLDNEPIELCRGELAGMAGRNERRGHLARRAVILIDPFFDPPDLGTAELPSVFKEIGELAGTWKSQARYDSQDLQLAVDEDCYSRFMITAKRDGAEPGGKSIATACLSAFGGFLCREFRRHDYFLGRRNCREFLLKDLLIPVANDDLFGPWKAKTPDFSQFVVKDALGRDCLRLIPLYGRCQEEEVVPGYPVGSFNPRARPFRDAVERRLSATVGSLIDSEDLPLIERWLLELAVAWKKGDWAKDVVKQVEHGLKQWKLL